jgi:hypothetical protein
MKPEGAPRPGPLTFHEKPVPDTPDRQEGSAADAVRTFLIEPLRDGLKETYRVLVTPEKPPAEERALAPEPIVIFVGQPPESPQVAPPADTEHTFPPAPPPVSAEERSEQQHARSHIDEILEALNQAA